MTKKEVARMCIACRKVVLRSLLFRIKRENGVVSVDESSENASGRGCYICKNAQCVEQVIKKRLVNRAFRCAVENDLYVSLQGLIKNE